MVDEQHGRPARRRSPADAARAPRSPCVESGGGLVEAEQARRAAARAPRRRACARPATARSASRRCDPRGRTGERALERGRSPAGPVTTSRTALSADGGRRRRCSPQRSGRRRARCTATCGRAEPRALVRRLAVRSRPSSSDAAAVGDEAGDRVDERRLAGAVRPDEPDELPWLDLRSTSTSARTPPKLTETPCASRTASRSHRGRPVLGVGQSAL